MLTRRQLLSASALMPMFSTLEAAQRRAARARLAMQASPQGLLFDIERVHPHAWIALARPAVMINCNAVIFEQTNGLVVVDTHSKPSAAAALLSQIATTVSAKPVRFLIQTHFHYDHTQGTPAYPSTASVIGTTTTRELLAELGEKRAASSVESMRRSAAEARRRLDAARDETERRYWRRHISETETFVREMRDYRPVLPDVSFPDGDSGLVLHDRLQDLHLLFRGRAHTASDICVWSPQSRLLATGDLLSGFLPGMGDGYPLEWPATLRAVGMLEFDHVLPGHGEVQQGKRQLTLLTGYIEELNEAVVRAKERGDSLDRVQQTVTPASLLSLSGDFGHYVVESEGRFRLWAPGTNAGQAIARAVRSNIARIYETA
ncbi:MAG: MBL fold metallo-hydrolase [Bryobacteraceae bacterium]